MARKRRKRPASPTLAQAGDEYLDWQALDRGRCPNTVRAYGIDLARFRTFAGKAGVELLGEVDWDLLREFQVDMARGERGRPRLSPQTRYRRRAQQATTPTMSSCTKSKMRAMATSFRRM